jgi:hypothetical protein
MAPPLAGAAAGGGGGQYVMLVKSAVRVLQAEGLTPAALELVGSLLAAAVHSSSGSAPARSGVSGGEADDVADDVAWDPQKLTWLQEELGEEPLVEALLAACGDPSSRLALALACVRPNPP